VGVANDVQLLQLLPEAPYAARDFQESVFTAYDANTRTFVTVADSYPAAGSATTWSSTLAPNLDSAAPTVSGAKVAYPVSSSPFPLNVEPLALSRVLFAKDSLLLAVFTNGEVHSFNVTTGTFAKLLDLIPAAQQLGPTHPFATAAQAYDPTTDSLLSLVFAASDAFAVETNLASFTNKGWVALSYPEVDPEGTNIPLENFISAHVMDLPDGSHNFVVTTESINNNQGFDQILAVNLTSGVFDGPVFNLMNYEVLLECPAMECDMARVSCWDPANFRLYFQGHTIVGDDEINLSISSLGFDLGAATGNLQYYVNEQISIAAPGYSGFQWATYENATAAEREIVHI
jgi:hypothetical protein